MRVNFSFIIVKFLTCNTCVYFNHWSTWFNNMSIISSIEKGKKHGQVLSKEFSLPQNNSIKQKTDWNYKKSFPSCWLYVIIKIKPLKNIETPIFLPFSRHKSSKWDYFVKTIKLTGSAQFCIFLLLYISKQKFAYWFLAEKNSISKEVLDLYT